MDRERSRIFLAVNLGHVSIDVFNSMGPVLLTFLSVPLVLTNGQIGFAIGLYQMLAAVTQPPFGWLADRIGSRWLGPGSVAWTVGFVLLAVFVGLQTQSFLTFLLLYAVGALGSGAFHPQGAMHASRGLVGQAATATAVFFLFGQGGLASGPFLSGLLLDRTGPSGLYLLAVPVVPVVLFMLLAMRQAHPEPRRRPAGSDPGHATRNGDTRWFVVALLAVVSGLRGWAFMGTAFFLPKLFHDLGWSATAYGSITGLFWLGAGITGVMAGRFADRWGRRKVVFTSILSGCLTLFFLPLSQGALAFVLAIASGGLLGASHSILVVLGQDLLPARRGLASGFSLGYLFGVGAVAGWSIGLLSEHWGLAAILQTGALGGCLAAGLSLVLPSTGNEPRAEPVRAPA